MKTKELSAVFPPEDQLRLRPFTKYIARRRGATEYYVRLVIRGYRSHRTELAKGIIKDAEYILNCLKYFEKPVLPN